MYYNEQPINTQDCTFLSFHCILMNKRDNFLTYSMHAGSTFTGSTSGGRADTPVNSSSSDETGSKSSLNRTQSATITTSTSIDEGHSATVYYGYDTDEESDSQELESQDRGDHLTSSGLKSRRKEHKQTVIKRVLHEVNNKSLKPEQSPNIVNFLRQETEDKLPEQMESRISSSVVGSNSSQPLNSQRSALSTGGDRCTASLPSVSSDADDYRSVLSQRNSSSSSQYHSMTEQPSGTPPTDHNRRRLQVGH